jgi:hypothetical protein
MNAHGTANSMSDLPCTPARASQSLEEVNIQMMIKGYRQRGAAKRPIANPVVPQSMRNTIQAISYL